VTPAGLLTLALVAAAPTAQAQATSTAPISVPPSSAIDAVNRLAAQAGVDVVMAVDLSGQRSAGLRGRLSVVQAFDRLLRPLGARAVPLGRGVYRIEAAPAVAPARRVPIKPRSAASEAPTQLDEVIVTAPVHRGGLDGANGRSPVDAGALERLAGAGSSEAIADLSPTVDSTRQGSGRNKLFVRGLADSAFSGPLQATVGQYLGDLRLTYGSPDPDLALIDIRRVEVFEGPQGSRFGSGSIGGVVRITPEPPNPEAASGSFVIGGSATRGGGAGADAAVVVNRPLNDRIGWRVVAYGRREGGFINSPVRGEDDADGVDTVGARTALRITGGAWTVDGLALVQTTHADDAQLVPDARHLETAGPIAQPYESSLALLGLSASRRSGGFRLTSATSLSRQVLDERFDATVAGPDGDAVVDRRQTTEAFSTEVRIESDPDALWAWNGGAALATGDTKARRQRRPLDPANGATWGVDLSRHFTEAALFGEVIAKPSDTLAFAFGGRLAFVRIINRIEAMGLPAAGRTLDPDGFDTGFTPTIDVRWSSPVGVQVFGRFEQGVRPAGVSEAEGALERYDPDRVSLVETGLRSRPGQGPWSAEVSVGYLDWRDIQADTVTIGGDLVTANIGDGVIHFVQLKAAWRVGDRLYLSGGAFANHSRVDLEGLGTIGVDGGVIPNVAPYGAQFSLDYGPVSFAGLPLSLGADLRYVGRSQLGLGPGLDTSQGDYVRADLSARLGDERRALVLRVNNPLDVRATRFGLGSPYQLFDPHVAPLRPLTIRVGFETAF